MLSWIGTRVFYAIVFFMLGAWVASVAPGMKNGIRHASDYGAQSFANLRDWASSTLNSNVKAPEAPKEAAAEPAAPAAASAGPDILFNARAAYARHDVLGAINAYRDFIDSNPGAVDARGELGNVYFNSGRLRDASQIYYEAALLKLNRGDVEGAKAFVGAVRQGDGPLADDLERRIAPVKK